MSPKAQYLLALGLWICFPDERNPPVATSRPELPDPAAQSGSSNPMIYEGVSARAWNATRRAESVPSALPPPQSIGTVTALPQSPEGVADQSVCQRQPTCHSPILRECYTHHTTSPILTQARAANHQHLHLPCYHWESSQHN